MAQEWTPSQFATFLDSQNPNYDMDIERDIRPELSEMLGYFEERPWAAYSGVTHKLDRFKSVQANTTLPWEDVADNTTDAGSCFGNPCDPELNQIGYGYQRVDYSRSRFSMSTQIFCFDQVMQFNQGVDHMAQIISQVLAPATKMQQSYFTMRKVLELAEKKVALVNSGSNVADFTFTWDAGGYEFLNTTQDPEGVVTSNFLRSRVERDHLLGATNARGNGFSALDLMTDMDTFHYLAKEDPTLKNAWRFGEFDGKAKEFYEYGFRGFVGDHMVKVLFTPLRFNKVQDGRYQLVLPYVNNPVTSGIGDDFNEDFSSAIYQMSFKVNPKALQIMPFRAKPINPQMPFRIRDYGGNWFWVMNDLPNGQGGTIPNPRNNKGMFLSDFDIGVRPAHPEWLTAIFHQRMLPCVTNVATCASDPGYPAQNYDMANATCDTEIIFSLPLGSGTYDVAANAVTCDENPLVHSAATGATLTLLVNSLNSVLSELGTWAVETDTATELVALTDLACTGGGTTVTSATGGFTAAMVNKYLRITGAGTGSHGVLGYYKITGYTDTNTITVASTPTDGTAMVSGDGEVYSGASRISVTGSCTDVDLPVTLS